MNLLVLELDYVFVRDVQIAQLLDFILLDLLQESLLALESLLQLLVLDVLDLFVALLPLVLLYYLFLQLDCMLLQQLLPFVL